MFETVLIYSNNNLLINNLINIFLKNNLHLEIVNKNTGWEEPLKENTQINFTNSSREINPNYVVIHSSLLQDDENKINEVIKITKFHKVKTIYIDEYKNYEAINKGIILPDYLEVMVVGDIFGNKSIPEESEVLKYINKEKSNYLGSDKEFIYPTYAKGAANDIFKNLLSFGPYGKVTFLSGGTISTKELLNFWKSKRKKILATEIKDPKFLEKFDRSEILRNGHFKTFSKLVRAISREDQISSHPQTAQILVPKKTIESRTVVQRQSKTNLKKSLAYVLVAYCLFLIFPYLLTAFSFFNVLVLGNIYKKVSPSTYKTLSQVSQNITLSSIKLSKNYYHIPIGGIIYKDSLFISEVLSGVSDISLKSFKLNEDFASLLDNATNDKKYNPSSYSDNLTAEIDDLFNETSFLQAKLLAGNDTSGLFLDSLLSNYDLTKTKSLLLRARVVASNLSDLVGFKKQKTYLILFQNNNNLRPTGGVIEYYGLAVFNKGMLTNFNINTTKKVDDDLKGSVTPPLQMSLYLKENNWYLKNSNWDLSFVSSAQRAEWFLNREENVNVDGVITTDYETVKNILKYAGSFKYNNTNIDSRNISQVLSAESIGGVNNKVSQSPLLFKFLFDQVGVKIKDGSLDYSSIAQIINNSFEEKHSLIFLHNKQVQDAFTEMGFSGDLSATYCTDKCITDASGIYFADALDSSSNLDVKKDYRLEVTVSDKNINRVLEINIINKSKSAAYKTYLRVITPGESSEGDLFVKSQKTTETLSPTVDEIGGRKEVGTFVEVAPGEQKKVRYSWTTDVANNGGNNNYLFKWIKQPGTDLEKIAVQITTPQKIKNFKSTPGLVDKISYDAKRTIVLYNTILNQDVLLVLGW